MAKKKYQVIKATTREIPGVFVGGKKRMFGANGSFETNDPGEAAEINKVLGAKGTGEVVVTNFQEKEPGHNYTFSGVDMKNRGGNERVRVKTTSGYTYMSREQAEELELEIVSQKRANAGEKPEEQDGL